MTQLGSNVRHRRIVLGMSMEELAIKAGYAHKASIYHIEAGDADVPMKRAERIAKALGCDLEDLISGEEDRER